MKRTSLLPFIIAGMTAALAVSMLPILSSTTQAARLLPFQGRLTDAAGNPVADGAKVVQFKIYDAPTGGTAVWNGEVQKLTVNGGLVSTLLGSKADLSSVDFNQTLYLEITLDANADSQVTAADPPLLPRQSVLPAVFAVEAQSARDSQKLEGYSLANLPGAMPVGTVVMWWGNKTAIPIGWEVCDGAAPTTANAVLTGSKPDLRDRFPKGATSAAIDVKSSSIAGGANSIPQRTTGATALNPNQIPPHQHSGTTARANSMQYTTVGRNDEGVNADGSNPDHQRGWSGGAQFWNRNDGNFSLANHTHNFTTNTVGGGQAHDHSIPAQDNRPAFLELFFIIRVK